MAARALRATKVDFIVTELWLNTKSVCGMHVSEMCSDVCPASVRVGDAMGSLEGERRVAPEPLKENKPRANCCSQNLAACC